MTLSARCAGTECGIACIEAATETIPVPLCTRHRMQVALSIVPQMMAFAAISVAGPVRSSDVPTGRLVRYAKHVEPDLSGSHDPRVYLIANSGRVKIGYTTNLQGRLSALTLRADAVVLFLVGGRDLEAALHRHFVAARIDETEWFHRTPETEAYIASKTQSLPPVERCPEEEVDLADDVLREAAIRQIGARPGAHLVQILAALQNEGHPQGWTVSGLRRAYERIGLPTRNAVRVGKRITVGIHRNDLAIDETTHVKVTREVTNR